MCGILGELRFGGPVDLEAFGRRLDTLAARGPDRAGQRSLDEGRVALGHRRLSIIDLSEAGDQPIANEDGSVWLTYNGEIYNFRELRAELRAAGHQFRGHSDSEVIVHAYEQWGEACVRRFRGIFAFGIWDGPRRRLLLARDHLGVKPLFYAADGERVVFASQPRAIVEDPRFERRLDHEAFRDYLAYGIVPWDRSIFEGIRVLPPAHVLTWEDGRVRTERFWEPRYEPVIRDPEEARRAVRAKVEETVGAQLVSDVPVGLFLSGGIDSSAVAAIACRHSGGALDTFTIGFEEEKKDERPYANLVVDLLHTKHHERVLDFGTALDLVPEVVEAYDEPFYYSSAFPTYLVSRLVQSTGLKVILSGDGGDELFAGYTRYDDFHGAMTASRPAALAGAARRWLQGLRPLLPATDPMADYFRHEGLLRWEEQAPLWPDAARRALDPDVLWRLRRFYRSDLPPVTAAQIVDVHTFLADEILSKVDRASMACGVEVRVPLLDPELVDLAFQISADVVYRGGERKAVLKAAVRDLLPPEILTTRKKGFSIPMNDWMRRGILAWGLPLLRDGVLVQRGAIDPSALDRYVERHAPKRTWLLLAAELWARRWLERQDVEALAKSLPRG